MSVLFSIQYNRFLASVIARSVSCRRLGSISHTTQLTLIVSQSTNTDEWEAEEPYMQNLHPYIPFYLPYYVIINITNLGNGPQLEGIMKVIYQR